MKYNIIDTRTATTNTVDDVFHSVRLIHNQGHDKDCLIIDVSQSFKSDVEFDNDIYGLHPVTGIDKTDEEVFLISDLEKEGQGVCLSELVSILEEIKNQDANTPVFLKILYNDCVEILTSSIYGAEWVESADGDVLALPYSI